MHLDRLRPSGLAVTVAATVALGVAALTTAFNVADAALWRDPPFPNAGELVVLLSTRQSATEPVRRERWSYPRIRRLRETLRSVPRIANFSPASMSLTGTDRSELLPGEVVSPEYFTVLGVAPAVGRGFAPDDDAVPGRNPVAVLSDDLWRRRFAGDPAVLGRTIELNRRALTIVGVMPPGFRGLSDAAQVWIPTSMAPLISYAEYLTTNQNFIGLVTRADRRAEPALAAELAAVTPAIAREFPSDDDEPTTVVGFVAVPLGTIRVPADLRRAPWLLLAAVTLLHLLACANAISLLLGRAVAGRRDAAIRASLGGSAGVLFRRAFAQAALPVAVGAVAGLAAAWWAGRLEMPMNAWGARNFYGSIAAFADPRFGWRSVLAWLVLAVATVVLVAWGPALVTVRGDLAKLLREGGLGAGAKGLSLRRPSARGVIVAAEMAFAVVLLGVGGLMIQSFARMRATPLGVDAERVLTFALRPSEVDVSTKDAPAFVQRMIDAVAAVPGVEAVSVDGGAPLSGSALSTLRILGQPVPAPDAEIVVRRHYVGPDHFRALGIPLVRGRAFTDRDRAGTPRVAVISESAARRFWPGEDPIGRRVWFGGGSSFDRPDSSAEIIGIVGDVKYQPLDQAPNAASFYTPFQQFTYASRTYFVRTAGDPLAMVPGIRAAVRTVDPNVPMAEVRALTDVIGASWSRNRFDSYFYGAFAVLALVLAATGVYSVVAYAVRQRDREIAIRMAVGASPAGVFRLVVLEGMTLPLAGLVVGGGATVLVTGLVRGSLYGVAPGDPRIPALAALVLVAVAVAACALPARRAMRVDPQTTLRTD